MMEKKVTVLRIVIASLASTAIFFLVTNFICWPGNSAYIRDLSRLMACYAAGISFLQGTFLGDLFYRGVLLGVFALAQKQWPVLRLQYV